MGKKHNMVLMEAAEKEKQEIKVKWYFGWLFCLLI